MSEERPGALAGHDLVEERISLCGRELSLLRPPDAEALLDDEAFEHEEFLPYWAELWPSGLALAHRVCERPLAGARVLELGCGLALPSFAAALRGAAVVASDWSPDAVALTARNAARNGIALETTVVDWSDARSLVARAPWDLVLAADVLYERRNVATLLELLPQLVADDGEILLAEPGRPPARAFFDAAGKDWDVETEVEAGPPRVELYVLRKRRRAQ